MAQPQPGVANTNPTHFILPESIRAQIISYLDTSNLPHRDVMKMVTWLARLQPLSVSAGPSETAPKVGEGGDDSDKLAEKPKKKRKE